MTMAPMDSVSREFPTTYVLVPNDYFEGEDEPQHIPLTHDRSPRHCSSVAHSSPSKAPMALNNLLRMALKAQQYRIQ
jgi:hypothetical protein